MARETVPLPQGDRESGPGAPSQDIALQSLGAKAQLGGSGTQLAGQR